MVSLKVVPFFLAGKVWGLVFHVFRGYSVNFLFSKANRWFCDKS